MPNAAEIERQVALVENSEHDLLAEQRGQRRHAEVDDLVAHLQLDAAVLRHASLGDVELRHDLEARDERRLELHRRLHHFLQRAVDAVANADLVLEALEVNVRRAALHGVGENGVDQLDDRRVLHLRLERRLRDLLFGLLDDLDVAASLGFELADGVHERRHLRFVASRRTILSISPRSVYSPDEHREDVVARDELEILEHAEVRRIGHRDGERATVALERNDEVLLRQIRRDHLRDFRIDLESREIDGRHLVLLGQHLGELDLRNEAELDQVVADARAVLLLLLQRLGRAAPA